MTSNATIQDETASRKKKVAAITTGLVLVGGAAFAYWTTSGNGTGLGTTRSTVAALTAVQTSTVSNLQPGGTAQALSGNFNNTNTGPVYVASVTVAISSVVDSNGDPIVGCDGTDYTLGGEVMTVGQQVPAGTGVGSWSGATIAFNNKSTNQDACKGATVRLAYTIS